MSGLYRKILVVKRDGSKQHYDPDKIAQVAIAAGLETSKTAKLTQAVNDWIESLNRLEVTSLEIRDKVLSVLVKLNPQVADLYRWYQKTKG